MKYILIVFCLLFSLGAKADELSVRIDELSVRILEMLFEKNNQICESYNIGQYELGEYPITRIDISNDGINDYIVDEGRGHCTESIASPFWGTGGSPFIFYINPTLENINAIQSFNQTIRSWKLIDYEGKKAVKIQIHGNYCGVDAQGCYEILLFTDKGPKSVDGPHPNPK